MIEIYQAGIEDIPILIHLAEKTWSHTYQSILEKEQIDYMFEEIYSPESLEKQMAVSGHTFLILKKDEQPVAYASFSKRTEDPSKHKLHKIYVLPSEQGNQFGKMLLSEVERRVLEEGNNILELNVNRYNEAKSFYEKSGYLVVKEEDIPIGKYWMNDYVMSKKL